MSSTADRTSVALAPADGLQLLGEVAGSGYEQGASLVRRADGQMVQLGPLVYALLEEVDGARDHSDLAKAMCEKLGRDCDVQHVAAIAQKLAEQGLLAGSEANAPERVNPLLALRWKVVVTDPELTGRLTAPFRALFRPWVLVPVVAAFLAVTWFVLGEQGIASGAAQAFARPELILLLFVLGVAAAGFHELGHAAACRYGGGTPGAMGMGIYLVWPAFYTDVTDSYRLPKRARLRTDLGGLYFNAIVAVATFAAWLVLGIDSLLLLIGLQLVEMVKQLSPVIRADGYHILSDVTGVPDLYAHMVPTLKRLLPGHHSEEAALTGRARLIVTLWVLAIVPLLLLLTLSMVLLLPKLVASAWESGSLLVPALGDQVQAGAMVDVFVSLLRLVGLALPVLGGANLAWRLLGGAGRRAVGWSRGRPARRALVVALAAGVAAALTWMWWPTGQYEPIRASDR
ncbi:MAG: Tat (Twin-arginine translocation) pathway signal sequence domain protein, partial [Thermoleophilia bacterium]|nr:Tat (Twin-arginine translocation) pathway signal sequence domain protein [Thermoleophilia bacterium]